MATTKAPLFGLDASGSLANSIVFSKWKGRTYVRRHSVPSNPKTFAQIGIRAVMKFITQDYKNLSAADKADWQVLAASTNITPLNAQVKDAINRAKLGEGWRQNTTDAPLGTIDPPTALVSTALPKGLRLSWTRPVANKGDYSAVLYLYLVTASTLAITNLRVIVPVATVSVDVFGLTTGTTYFWKVAETGTAGEIGTASAEDSDAPA